MPLLSRLLPEGAFVVQFDGRAGASCSATSGRVEHVVSGRDMVGNVAEWTGDWIPGAGACTGGNWSNLTGFGVGDALCPIPTALHRGGILASGDLAGVFAGGNSRPDSAIEEIGFRCAR